MIINAYLEPLYIYVIANILAPILIILLPQLAKHTKSGLMMLMMMVIIMMSMMIVVVTMIVMIMMMMLFMVIVIC